MRHRRAPSRGGSPLDLDACRALEHVLVSTSGGSFHGFMDEPLDGLGRRRNVVLSVQNFTYPRNQADAGNAWLRETLARIAALAA